MEPYLKPLGLYFTEVILSQVDTIDYLYFDFFFNVIHLSFPVFAGFDLFSEPKVNVYFALFFLSGSFFFKFSAISSPFLLILKFLCRILLLFCLSLFSFRSVP